MRPCTNRVLVVVLAVVTATSALATATSAQTAPPPVDRWYGVDGRPGRDAPAPPDGQRPRPTPAQVRAALLETYASVRAVAPPGAMGEELLRSVPSEQEFAALIDRAGAPALAAVADAPMAPGLLRLPVQLRDAREVDAAADRIRDAARSARPAPPDPEPADVDACDFFTTYTGLRSSELVLEIVALVLGSIGDTLAATKLTSPAAAGLHVAEGVALAVKESFSFTRDHLDCTAGFLMDYTDNIDASATGTYAALVAQNARVKALTATVKDLEGQLVPPDGGAGGGGSVPPPPGGGEAPPDKATEDMAALLAAFSDLREQVQRTIGGNTQAISNQVRTLQETLVVGLDEVAAALDQQSETTPLDLGSTALLVKQQLAAQGPPVTVLLSPASAGGLLDGPGGAREVVAAALAAATEAGLAFDEAGARAAAEEGDAALAAGDHRAAFAGYRAAYRAIVL